MYQPRFCGVEIRLVIRLLFVREMQECLVLVLFVSYFAFNVHPDVKILQIIK